MFSPAINALTPALALQIDTSRLMKKAALEGALIGAGQTRELVADDGDRPARQDAGPGR